MAAFDLSRAKKELRRRPPIARADTAHAAVATILRDGGADAEVLLIERADRPGDPWSGQLAFPGGKREPIDESLLLTAVRETREEIGLALDPATCLTRLDDVIARTRGTRVAQFVFALEGEMPGLTPNAEVTDTLWVPLELLASSESQATFVYRTADATFETPCVRLGARVLWGMTYRMARQLAEALGRT